MVLCPHCKFWICHLSKTELHGLWLFPWKQSVWQILTKIDPIRMTALNYLETLPWNNTFYPTVCTVKNDKLMNNILQLKNGFGKMTCMENCWKHCLPITKQVSYIEFHCPKFFSFHCVKKKSMMPWLVCFAGLEPERNIRQHCYQRSSNHNINFISSKNFFFINKSWPYSLSF